MKDKNNTNSEIESKLGKRSGPDNDDTKFKDAVNKVQVLGVAKNLE